MSRMTSLSLAVAALLAAAAPAAAASAVPGTPGLDRVPHALPAPGAHAAAASRWIVGARPSAAAARIARAHGARALRLRGAYDVPAGRARGLALALRRHGLLRFSEPDRALRRQASFEGHETEWARGPIVPAGMTPPANLATIGVVDDLVDTSVPDVSQARVIKSGLKTVVGGHGTAVASVAAGQANGTGVVGIAPGAPIKTFGLTAESPCSEVANGIIDTVSSGVKVLNLSLGTTDDCFLLQLAVADAFGNDTLVVAAAGNEFQSGNPIVYPAAYPHVLSVGAVDELLQPTYFSSSNASIDLAAPGEDIPVAVPPAFDTRDGYRDGVSKEDGTSFAAPIVSGVASWLIAARPRLHAGQYADLLRHSAKDLGDAGWDESTGFGLVDLPGALAAATPAADPDEPNDGITLVNGKVFETPSPYVWKGGRARTVQASVDPVEDPVDVYRIRVPARRRAAVSLTPSAGGADLAVYDGKAKGLQAKALARSRRPAGATAVAHVRNRTRKARAYFVAVSAPSLKERVFDAHYALTIKRG